MTTARLTVVLLLLLIGGGNIPVAQNPSSGSDQSAAPMTESAKIQWLIDHVAKLPDAVFIRNDQEHSPADAASHMRRKLDAAGDRVKTAREFIEHCASRSSESGKPYLIRFKDGREVASGAYLAEALQSLERDPASTKDPVDHPVDARPMSQQIREGLKPLEPLLGQWQGELIAPAREGQAEARIPIVWTNAWSFDGRWLRMEFASKEPRGERGYMEWIGLFTFNPAEKRIETVWMTPRIRTREGSFLDGRDIFFEKGAFNAAGNVFTLIASKQYGKEAPVVEVQSTFTITDADHFVCVDAEKDPATGAWNQSGRFELTRVK